MAKAGRAAATWRAYQEVSQPGSPGLLTRLRALPRMIRGSMRGDFPGLSRGRLGMLGMAVLYIVSPIDAIPEFFIGIGIVDDFGVFLWLVTSLLGASGEYVQWERAGMPRSGATPRGNAAHGNAAHGNAAHGNAAHGNAAHGGAVNGGTVYGGADPGVPGGGVQGRGVPRGKGRRGAR
ncbi:hypothetical protein GCM10023194_08290 [Planotetraspora phitsanulokensis]|uniref:DUF1232 domain-containing protein n=1 Tax=Planotetraspora phitsanulokensis TaxID=575192 RepID=A0A8J3U7Z2_9ACTN|nr:YkvA family protein [Planotetraspora phitsanulokensis]GII39985.1 hypothetical protein Pph01_49880 [Planotetraspora phitsanulokensis]